MLADFVALMRPKHYLKNALIFVPLVFSGELFNTHKFVATLGAAIIFSAAASVVYIINDINDAEKDRMHPTKKLRPIASGAVSKSQAFMLAATLVAMVLAISILTGLAVAGWLLLIGYLLINVAYSLGLKNIPIVDVGIMALGFMIRVMYGGSVAGVAVSRWLYLTVLMGAFYVSLGKRRNEVALIGSKARKVNQFYSFNFLDKNMYVCLALTLVFYSLWATDPARGSAALFWTIPVTVLILMAYSLDIEKSGSSGDPIEVLTGDKILSLFALAYIVLTVVLLRI